MKISGAVLLAVVAATPAAAVDKKATKFAEGLKKLDLETRLEQICDYEAMRRSAATEKNSVLIASQSNAVSELKHEGSMLIANGAAFRSKGQWYQFSFTCKGAPDDLSVVSFACRNYA